MKTFGDALRDARQQAGKTMADVARHLSVSVPYVSDVENGRRGPFSPINTLKAADLLGIEATELLASAAMSRGAFELDANNATQQRQKVGAALMREWPGMSDDDLERIDALLRELRRP